MAKLDSVIEFFMFTYEGPDVYTGPVLGLAGKLCERRLRQPRPITINFTVWPFQLLYYDSSWEHFTAGIRQGRLDSFTICQAADRYGEPDSPEDEEPFTFSLDAQLLPANGLPKPPSDDMMRRSVGDKWDKIKDQSPFNDMFGNLYGSLQRHPSLVALWIDLDAFKDPDGSDFDAQLLDWEKQLVTCARASYACTTKARHVKERYMPMLPALGNRMSMLADLDSRIPEPAWAMFLGPEHIRKLGGKDAIRGVFPECRVDDMSSEQTERLYVQMTDRIDQFTRKTRSGLQARLQPLLRSAEQAVELPIRYTDHVDSENLGFTIALGKPVSSRMLKRIEKLIETWYEEVLYKGEGSGNLETLSEIEYDEDDLLISWTVTDMPTTEEEPIQTLAKQLAELDTASKAVSFKELIIGYITEEL